MSCVVCVWAGAHVACGLFDAIARVQVTMHTVTQFAAVGIWHSVYQCVCKCSAL